MRKRFYILLLMFSLLTGASAQVSHWGGFSLGGGLSMLLPQPAGDVKAKIGGVGDFSVLYELQAGHFLLHTGVGISYSVNRSGVDIPRFGATITEYETLTYQYDTHSFTETNNIFQGYIPLMVGAKFGRFNFLLGAKVNLLHTSRFKDKAEVEIWGLDDDVLDPMYDLYTHSMGKKSYESEQQSYSMNKVPVMASAEVGVSLKQTDHSDIRLSVFADYTLNPSFTVDPNAKGAYVMTAIDKLEPQAIYGNLADQSVKVRQLQVGAKLTFLFGGGSTRRRRWPCLCEDY